MFTYYSDNLKIWYFAYKYQETELLQAIKNHFKYTNAPYKSQTKNADFQLYDRQDGIYTMIRPNGTVGYLTQSPYKQLVAKTDMEIPYLGTIVPIKKGSIYYVQANKPLEPIIGWHGSFNPPRNMDD